VGTCFQIMLYLKDKYPNASFAYVAEPKRHRVYRLGLARVFSDIEYEYYHVQIGENDIYALTHRLTYETNPHFFSVFDKVIDHYKNSF
jgi:hypothetical protein